MNEAISAREAFDNATYKQAADKIRQILSAIKNNPASSAKRWVWELMQNAKDIKNKFDKVSIEIELVSENELRFKHNGNPFSINNITGLIRQVSSKSSTNEDEETTGKFGTGFICTHLLSDIIEVKGVLNYDGYRPFDLTLDRSGRSSEELIPRIREIEKKFLEPDVHFSAIPNYEENRKEDDFDTIFIYYLSSNEKFKSATAGLDDLINTLPITLVTQAKKIKQVRVIDGVRNTDVVYICSSKKLDENVNLSEVRINNIIKQYLTYKTQEVALTIEVKVSEDGYELIKREKKQPVLYRDFPLIGSEEFYFPYTLNGFRLCPTEKRNSIPLNGEDNWEARANRDIITHAIEASLKFNEWLVANNATNRYLIAYSPKPKAEVDYDEDVALPWINDLQKRWRNKLLDQYLVESGDQKHQVRELSVPSFNSIGASEEFYSLLEGFYLGRGYLPNKEHLKGWLKIINADYAAWGQELKYEKDNFLTDLQAIGSISVLAEKLGKSFEEVITWLNKVYSFLIKHNGIDDFNKYKIIPNREGNFMFLEKLSSDYTNPISPALLDIYNYVMPADIQSEMIHGEIESQIFGPNLRTFNLNNIITWFNTKIKSADTFSLNGTSYYAKYSIAYQLLSLYPSAIEDTKYLAHRKSIYDFCKAYREMPNYTALNITDLDLWREADNLWFNISYEGIEKARFISKVASDFFVDSKTETETLEWINKYLQFYRESSKGEVISAHAVFPNQKGELKVLGGIRFDDNVAEEFKDLAAYAFGAGTYSEYYRNSLLHPAIEGYHQHNPLTVKEVYGFVKDKFDKGSLTVKDIIAKNTLSIVLKNDDSSESVLYNFVKTFYGNSIPELKQVDSAVGFSWLFAEEFYIKNLCYSISTTINISGLKSRSDSFNNKSDEELVSWIDSLIEFLHSYKNKKYWPIITDKETGYGIWVNQNNDFCKFQMVRKDDGIPEDLKDLARNNRHINKDYREVLFSSLSSSYPYLETTPLTISEIGEDIDAKINAYEGNKQEADFRNLVFALNKLTSWYTPLREAMKNFEKNKNSLIVGSMGEGETMDLVSSLIQQGDDKLKAVKELLVDTTIEELNNLNSVLRNCTSEKFEQIKDIISQFATDENHADDGETPMGVGDEMEIVVAPKIHEIKVEDFEGRTQIVKLDQVQYAGLSLEEIEMYVSEAKAAVVKYYRELNDRNPELGLQFDNERIASHSYSQLYGISDKNGIEIPIVVHSYKGPQYRYFDLNWYDWQLLSKPGAELWVLTVTGLQCIPLYALPVRRFSFDLENMSHNSRAVLQTLAAVGKKSLDDNNSGCNITFDFGNVMPTGFVKRCCFDSVPGQLENCIDTIKQVCEANVPQIANLYNSGKCIPIRSSAIGYSRALREVENDMTMAELFEAQSKENYHPATIGTTHID